MTVKNKFKTVPLDEMIDRHVGKRGTKKRDAFENKLRIDLLGQAIKQARQKGFTNIGWHSEKEK